MSEDLVTELRLIGYHQKSTKRRAQAALAETEGE